MKKLVLSLSILACAGSVAIAQTKKAPAHHGHDHPHPHEATAPKVSAATAPAVTMTAAPATDAKAETMEFNTMVHDFGTIAEGPNAEFDFVFTNTGKEPILINQVHASCGCTTPSWPKEPIMPGKSGTIKASYSTTGRPGNFTKTVTVLSGQGSKVLTIKGVVEKAPETSVPHNTSMIKTR